MHLKVLLGLASTASLAALASAEDAHSNLDWYGPSQTHTQVCGSPDDETLRDCDDFYNDVRDELHKKVMETCKETSCSGSFEHYKFQVEVEAVFPPEAKDEFDEQMGNIIDKMFTHENQKGIGPGAIETKFTIPSKLILNRFGDGNEKGHLEMTVTVQDEDGLCGIFQKLGTAGSILPEVGPFFGLIGIADC